MNYECDIINQTSIYLMFWYLTIVSLKYLIIGYYFVFVIDVSVFQSGAKSSFKGGLFLSCRFVSRFTVSSGFVYKTNSKPTFK